MKPYSILMTTIYIKYINKNKEKEKKSVLNFIINSPYKKKEK